MASLKARLRKFFGRPANNMQTPETSSPQPEPKEHIAKTQQAQPAQQRQQVDHPTRQSIYRPAHHNRAMVTAPKKATSTGPTLQIQLQNQTTSSQVYAYITGLALDQSNALFLLSYDGQTPYYAPNSTSTGTAINHNISINLGPPGNTATCTIPRLAGARLWFSVGKTLQFLVNPGPGLVEPSIYNPSDPNSSTNFGFCEFTFDGGFFGNISYVDFIALPIALTLTDTSGVTQHVSGLPPCGLASIANGLIAQTAKDKQAWSSCIPNSCILLNPNAFKGYFEPYVSQVYAKYANTPLTVGTQASHNNVQARASNGVLDFGNGCTFAMPTTQDIFSCSTGPFATGSNAETNVIIPRLAAAFNRTTVLASGNEPNGTNASQYYTNPVTNHYARVVHGANLDGHGYAFPYDDVTPDIGVAQEGAVYSLAPQLWTVAVGGSGAYAG